MVVVKMGEENGSDIPDINSGFGDPTRRAIASVNDVERSIDNQQVRSLRPMDFRSRTGSRTESNDPRARLRPGRPSCALTIRDTAGSAAAPAANCRN
jgi:hypothetical protein